MSLFLFESIACANECVWTSMNKQEEKYKERIALIEEHVECGREEKKLEMIGESDAEHNGIIIQKTRKNQISRQRERKNDSKSKKTLTMDSGLHLCLCEYEMGRGWVFQTHLLN